MTIQGLDKIIIKGKSYGLDSYPLTSYWTDENPGPPIGCPRTSCYRGYEATWENIDDCLYLIDIKYRAPGGDVGWEYVFPKTKEKLFADWYSDEPGVPFGEIWSGESYGFPVHYANWYIKIEKGRVISHRYKANY